MQVVFRTVRKEGFPPELPFFGTVVVAFNGRYYHDVPATGQMLASTFPGAVSGRYRVGFSGGKVFAFQESEIGAGYDQVDSLGLGVRGAVLCHHSVKEPIARHLREVCGGEPPQRTLTGLPGWCCFYDVLPRQASLLGPPLTAASVVDRPTLRIEGGLRVGRGNEWIAGAPPTRVVVIGGTCGRVRVNGNDITLSGEGVLETAALFAAPDSYQIEALGTAGAARTTIHVVPVQIAKMGGSLLPLAVIVPATIPPAAGSSEVAEPGLTDNGHGAVPSGLVLGAAPGQVASCGVHVAFCAQWQVGVIGGAPSVVALQPCPAAPVRLLADACARSRAAQQWAEAILRLRDARLGVVGSHANRSAVVTRWRAYVEVASRLREHGKNRVSGRRVR
jgi:hypothetical protein